MSYVTSGARLKAARDLRQWSQAVLSEQSGIPASRLSALETERRYPTEQEWEQLRECLRLGPYEPPVAPRRCHTAPPAPEQAERTFAQRFHAARCQFGSSAEQVMAQIKEREDAAVCLKFLQQARTESGVEAMLWMRLLAEGEVDGGGHRSDFDLQRQSHLGLEAVRQSPGDLQDPGLLPLLARRLAPLLALPRTA